MTSSFKIAYIIFGFGILALGAVLESSNLELSITPVQTVGS